MNLITNKIQNYAQTKGFSFLGAEWNSILGRNYWELNHINRITFGGKIIELHGKMYTLTREINVSNSKQNTRTP